MAGARKALLIVAVMTAALFHGRGGHTGVVRRGEGFGLFIAAMLAVYDTPEGIAISLVPRVVRVDRAALWSVFSSLRQPLVAVPALLFGSSFEPLPYMGLGFAGGATIWMVFSELVPDALDESSTNLISVVVTLSIGAMITFQLLVR